MARFEIRLSRSAERVLKKLPKKDLERVVFSIQQLTHNPFPRGCRKLRGEENAYRIRVGYYRIIYEVHSDVLTVLVLKIGQRKDVYR